VPAIPLIAFGGGVTMTLPYALLMPMMPPEQHGSVTGLSSISRGVGIMLGPLLAGIAVQFGSGPLSGTHGYAAMWLVASAAILGSLRLLARISARRATPEPGELATLMPRPPGAFSSMRRGAVSGWVGIAQPLT
jgi:MFS family permease